jgi:hypothetical protein
MKHIQSVRNFLDGVAIPRGNADLDGAFTLDGALTSKTRIDLKPGGFLDSVFFIFIRLGDTALPLLQIDVTCRTGADRTAGMFDVDSLFHCQFEKCLTNTPHQIPFGLIGLGETLRILENELHGDDGWTVGMTGIAHVHEGALDAG